MHFSSQKESYFPGVNIIFPRKCLFRGDPTTPGGESPRRAGGREALGRDPGGRALTHPTAARCQTGALALALQLFGNSERKHSQAAAPRAGERRGEGGATLFYPTLFPAPASPRQLRLPCHLNEDFQKDAGAHKWTETPGVLGELRQSLAGKAESC